MTDRQTADRMDGRTDNPGKNNMSPNPKGGRHNFAWICKQHQDLIDSVLIFRTKIILYGPEFSLVRCGNLNEANGSKLIFHMRIYLYVTSMNIQ